MPNLICRRVSFGYDGSDTNVFTDLDLLIDTSWRAALVGANGRGKTTLLRLLAGELLPDRGELELPLPTIRLRDASQFGGATAFEAAKDQAGPYRRWEAQIEALLAAGDAAALARYGEIESRYRERAGYELDARLGAELAGLEVPERLWSRPLDSLSGGEQSRCLLAGLFAVDSAYRLIDEPTNHLDRQGRERLADYLSARSGFLLVSHDRAFLDRSADHVLALNADTVESHRMPFSAWRAAYLDRLRAQERQNTRLKKDIARLESAARERRAGADAREDEKTAGRRQTLPTDRGKDSGFIGARAARQMKRAIAVERRAAQAASDRRASLLDVERQYKVRVPEPPSAAPQRTPLLRAQALTLCRPQPLFAPISFELRAGDRLAILGANGSGKSSLLDLFRGEPLTFHGEWWRASGIEIASVAQLPRWRSGLLRERLALEGLEEGRFRQLMAALGVRGAVLDRPLEQLSQGQLKKIELARALSQPAHLLLWDEPLNYIDIDARENLEAALLTAPVAILFVEHDARFVERVATGSLHLEAPGVIEPRGAPGAASAAATTTQDQVHD